MFRIIIIIFSCSFFINAHSQPNWEKINQIIDGARSNESFEGTILLADRGEVIFHQSYGFVDDALKQPVKNSMKFSLASITKTFTAVIILRMIEDGKLGLDDNLADLLPELNIPDDSKISVHHLLLHISGLPNEQGEFYQSLKSPEEFVETVLAEAKPSKIGKFNYANIDYVLLGLIIEKIEGKQWAVVVEERILDPLQMTNTGFLERDNYPKDFAHTFSFEDEKRVKDPKFYIENFYSSACMYGDALDLLKFDQALYGETLINLASKEKLYTSYPEYNYTGYSVWTYDYPFTKPPVRVMERRGGIMGANNTLIRMLYLNRTIIILSNNSKFNPDSFGNASGLKEALMIEMASY